MGRAILCIIPRFVAARRPGAAIAMRSKSMPTEAAGPSYWIIVNSIANFNRSRDLGFTVQGMKSRHRKKAERMQPGDKIVYYLSGVKAFGGISTITSPY